MNLKAPFRLICICILLLFCSLFEQNNIYAKPEIPPYAKWGKIAMDKTKQKYPNADIIDYLHIGRETGPETSVEKFKLWLSENNKEFGIYIDITFNNKNEQFINIKFREEK